MASSHQAPGSGSQQGIPVIVRLDPPDAPYTNAEEYLRAIDHRDLPQTIRDCLNNAAEMDYYISAALRSAPVQRLLAFKPRMNPGDYRRFSTLRPWHNLHASFVYITGDERTPDCQHKTKGNQDKPCVSPFAGCVVPRSGLNIASGANFNTTACANHQYQCEGSRCILGVVAQGQVATAQPAAVQDQSAADQPHSATAPTSTLQLQGSQFPAPDTAGQPSGPQDDVGHLQTQQGYAPPAHTAMVPQYGSAQPFHGFTSPAHHAAPNSAAYSHLPPSQAQQLQTHPAPLHPDQGYAPQHYVDESYGQEHGNQDLVGQDLAGQDYGIPGPSGEEFILPNLDFFQNIDPTVSAQCGPYQYTTSQASTTHVHVPTAYASETYHQEHAAIHHLGGTSHSAHQPDAAGIGNVDQESMDVDTPGAAAAAHGAPHAAYDHSFRRHEEYRDNSGRQI